MLPVEKSYSAGHYYASAIGALIGLIICILTFIHIAYHYIQIFYKTEEDNFRRINRTVYILFFIICIVASVPLIQYGFIRSNLITRQSPESFTTFQCAFGFWSSWSFYIILCPFVYGIWVYRIQIALQDSMFRYPKHVYFTLHIILAAVAIILIVITWIPYSDTSYVLYYFYTTEHVYCGSITHPEHDDHHLTYTYTIGNIIFVCSQISLSCILTYMFTRRLYQIQSVLVKRHISCTSADSGARTPTSPIRPLSESTSPTDESKLNSISMEVVNSFEFTPPSPKVKLNELEESAKRNRAARKILGLHDMIKQQTILMLFVVLSSAVYGIAVALGSGWFVIQLIWPLNVNVVCVWLMFAPSKKYWRIAKTYCCCRLCYLNAKRDINARTCCLFC